VGAGLEVDLKPGGPMNWVGTGADGKRSTYVRGEVLQSEPPKLLRYTFALGSSSKTSRITIELVPESEATRVSVTHDQWAEHGKQAVKMTRLSCHRFRSNQVRLALSLLAYNLGNLWRRLTLPKRIENWSLTSLQQRLVKTGGRLVKHARYYWLLLAEGHLTKRLFGSMLGRIAGLSLPAG
jgi:hypothetical protein